jgi:hypothetical protein
LRKDIGNRLSFGGSSIAIVTFGASGVPHSYWSTQIILVFIISLRRRGFGGFGRQWQLIFSIQMSQGAIWSFIEHFEADLGYYFACARVAYLRLTTSLLFCLSLVVRIDNVAIS